jgi:DNA primase
MIPNSVVAEVRMRIDPVEVIGRRLDLRKAGTSFSGRCPFHADGTPSLRVYPDSKRFKCFGCGARGDVFEFLRRFEGKDFRTVVLELAAEAGVAVNESGPTARAPADDDTQVLARACDAALAHWIERLWGDSGGEARRYLQMRGIEAATARQYRVGYAPAEWHDLEGALHGRGFTDADLIRAGLLCESSNGRQSVHDRFRGRLIFPFVRGSRDVVGFGARLLTAAGDGAEHPKYLNSPETPLFKKGQLLFGLSEARAAIRAAGRAVLVEGYFDALALAQAGLREVAAAGGTAVTQHQVGLLQRSAAEELIVLFDTDAAGREAPARFAQALLAAGVTSRVAQLPGGPNDPDSFVRTHGMGALKKVLDAAVPLTEWLLERAIACRVAGTGTRTISVEQKLLIVRDLGPYVAAARPGLPRALIEQRIARRLELYIVALRAELARFREGRGQRDSAGGEAPCPA